MLEDLIIGGYGTIEPRLTPDFKRPFKMWSVDGSTIRIYADWSESTPEKPRYAQLTGLKGERGIISFRDDELIYMRTNVRSSTPFGLGNLEVGFNCYSSDTEVLTRRGWITWPDAKDTDYFATRSPRGVFQWQRAVQMHKKYYTGELVSFQSQSTDLLVTPNHRMLGRKVTTGKWRKRGDASLLYGELEFLPADKVEKLPRPYGVSGFQVPVKTKWCGRLPTLEDGKFRIKVLSQGKRGTRVSDVLVDLHNLVAFLGIWFAEGSVHGCLPTKMQTKEPAYVAAIAAEEDRLRTKFWAMPGRQYGVSVSQVKSSPSYLQIKDLLAKLPWNFQEYGEGGGFGVNDKVLHNFLFPFGNKYVKRLPRWLKDLPSEYLKTFIEWAVKGDGCVRKNGLRTYTTTSKRLADDLQELFVKIGSSASVCCYKRTRGPRPFRKGRGAAPIYYVLERSSEWDGIGEARRIPYNDFVYCATVPNETLYVRRNGKPMWCGNTVNAFLGVQDMATRSGSDQIHKTFLWWPSNLAPHQAQLIRRHVRNEIEGQGQLSIVANMPKPEVVEVKPVTPEDLLLDWQELLIRIIALSFDLSPMALGLERDVNRNTAEVMSESDFRAAVRPKAIIFQEYITRDLFWKILGWRDIKFSFMGLDDPDEQTQNEIYQIQLKNNIICPDEVRAKLGLPDQPGGWGKLTLSMYQILSMAARSESKPGASGQPGAGGQPGTGGGGQGNSGVPSELQGLDPEEIEEYRQAGLLPSAPQEGDEEQQKPPGILEQFTEQIQEWLDSTQKSARKKKSGKLKNNGKLVSDQKKRFKDREHEQTKEEAQSRDIEKRRQFSLVNRPSNKKQGSQFTGRFR